MPTHLPPAPSHLRECGTAYRGCAPCCPFASDEVLRMVLDWIGTVKRQEGLARFRDRWSAPEGDPAAFIERSIREVLHRPEALPGFVE